MPLGLGDVRAAAWRGPPECAWLDLRHLPSRGLLDAVIAPAHRAAITFAGQAALVVRNRVLVIAAGGGSAAAGGGADRVSDGEQVPEFGAGLVAGGLPGVLAWVSLEPIERQVGQPSGSLAWPGAGRRITGAGVGGGAAVRAGERDVPGRGSGGGHHVGQVPRRVAVDRAEACEIARTVGEPEPGHSRQGQMNRAAEPGQAGRFAEGLGSTTRLIAQEALRVSAEEQIEEHAGPDLVQVAWSAVRLQGAGDLADPGVGSDRLCRRQLAARQG